MGSIYHYTNMNALLSIVSNGELWATDTEFLNDATELKHAIKLLLARLDPAIEYVPNKYSLIESLDTIIISASKRYLGNVEPSARTFSILGLESVPQIVSFSKDYDSLEMWRAYAGIDGVCIELDSELLLADDELRFGYTLSLEDVVYGNDFPKDYFNDIERELSALRSKQEIAKYVDFELLHKLAVFKDDHFSKEQEVRLILRQTNCMGQYDLRVGAKHLVPYVRIPFNLQAIKSITVGPSLLKGRNREALERWKFSPKGDRAHFEIKESQIPYV